MKDEEPKLVYYKKYIEPGFTGRSNSKTYWSLRRRHESWSDVEERKGSECM